MAAVEIRPVTDDEFPDWARMIERSFGERISDERIEQWRRRVELDRTLVTIEDGRPTGAAATISFTMSLPDAEPVPCAGVTAVAVEFDRRRRGLLDRLMRRQLRDFQETGEPYAALYASESPIYGRYGYGMAAPVRHYRIRTEHAQLTTPAPRDTTAAVEVGDPARVPGIHERHRRLRGGMMDRSGEAWRQWLDDAPADDPEDRVRVLVTLEDRGYLAMRLRPSWGERGADGRADVYELVANDPEALLALYEAAFRTDLVGEVTFRHRPADDPLAEAVRYRSRLVQRVGEGLFVRLVDLPAALEARGYRTEEHVVLEVHDALIGSNAGRWALEVGPDGSSCSRSDAEPDLELDVRDLGAICLGGVTATTLVWARRIREVHEGAAARADRLFAVEHAPWNPFIF